MLCRNHVEVEEGVRRCTRCGSPFCGDCLVDVGGRPFCATCKTEQLLDFRSGVDATALSHATVLRRFAAQFLDGIIVNLPLYILMMFFVVGSSAGGGEPPFWINFLGIPLMFVYFVYEALMLQFRNGQTIGKKALHIRVVRADGAPLSSGQAWGRSAMRLVLGCLWIVDYIPALFTKEKTTLHDMVAGTRVIEVY